MAQWIAVPEPACNYKWYVVCTYLKTDPEGYGNGCEDDISSDFHMSGEIGAGNAVVIKPSSETPVSGGLLFAKIYEEAGLPAGVLSVVIGGRDDLGDSLLTHPIPRVLCFTGSTASGRRVGEIAGRDLKRACLELGGNSPFVVLSDAELDAAVDAAVFGKFLNPGQICISINRIIVEKTHYAEFLKRFTERVKQLKVGDPNNEGTVIGPIINRRQLEKITKLVGDTIAAGARVVLQGATEGLEYSVWRRKNVGGGPLRREVGHGRIYDNSLDYRSALGSSISVLKRAGTS